MGAPNDIIRTCFAKGECSWCGQQRRRVFRYGRLFGRFCNFSCAASFHDLDRNSFDYIHPEVNQ